VVAGVRAAAAPVPLEALADRAVRALGHEKTIATGWAGAGSFRELLRQSLPDDIRLTGEPPYLAFEPRRHGEEQQTAPTPIEVREARAEIAAAPAPQVAAAATAAELVRQATALPPVQPPAAVPPVPPAASARPADGVLVATRNGPPQPTPVPPPQPPRSDASAAIQQSIARIQEACQAPPLAPPEYRLLFEIMAKEINDNDLIGAQTLTNITQRAQERGLDVRRDDVRFVLEVVSEADPWFDQGASANLFAGRFRNFVVARCRGQGLNLSAEELDLVDAWFAGGTLPVAAARGGALGAPPAQPPATQPAVAHAQQAAPAEGRGSRWWSYDDGRQNAPEPQSPPAPQAAHGDEFPRIVRTRVRG
jgi:hypothetical protein